ncbi:glycosyltransferase [Shewanella mangrovisoli]|uniref:glycosyltransferase n=1 Tax=Shewanella mangrovisoli TaxID=2864211 RepID=UPI0035B96BC5
MNIAFYFPYPTVGGVSILFLRCANYLKEKHNVFLIDMHDGYMCRNLPSGCNYINYLDLERLPENTTIIFQSCPLWRIQDLKKAPRGTKLIFWNLYPQNLDPRILKSSVGLKNKIGKVINLFGYLRLRKLRETVHHLLEYDALFFMDGENHRKTCHYLNVDIVNPSFIPITNANGSDKKKRNKKNDDNKFKCILVSRIEGFKTSIVKHVITRLDNLHCKDILLTIVGDGKDLSIIKDHSANLKNIKVNFLGYMHHDLLSDLIYNQDLSFAMGTSALDSASLGVPTICLDYSNNEIKGLYKFRFIFDCNNWDLGREINTAEFYENECSLRGMLDIIRSQQHIVAEKTVSYYKCNHSEYIYSLLEEHLIKGKGVPIEIMLNDELHMVDVFTRLLVFIFGKHKIDDSGFINF